MRGSRWTENTTFAGMANPELEVQRINSALRRAGDLDDDVAAAIEAA